MERRAHYDSILDRSKRITWQDDCYVDLQSSSGPLSSQAETEGKSFPHRLIEVALILSYIYKIQDQTFLYNISL